MPIYAYRCDACGFAKDVLQKVSDEKLTVCPSCGKSTFTKQITAAGFQLKGTGWYATDFRSSGSAPAASTKPDAPSTDEAAKPATDASGKADAPASTPAPAAGTTSPPAA